MTAIRHNLQTKVFAPEGERLVSLLTVLKPGKKKKENAFLCLSLSQQQPVAARLRIVKPSKTGEGYEEKKNWLLREVKEVDGINPRKPVPEIQLRIRDKLYKWEIPNIVEKEPFIHQLYKLQTRYASSQKADFVNVSMPIDRMEVEAAAEADEESAGASRTEEFAALTAKESADFAALLAKCEGRIGQAEAFHARLSAQLSLLDGANIQSIMGSEEAVGELLQRLDAGLKEAEDLEELLDGLDELLGGVREAVEQMQEKDAVIGTESENRRRLMDTLELFLGGVELLSEHEEALSSADLSNPKSIQRVTIAAQQLQKTLSAHIPQGMSGMKAYKNQQALFGKLADRLAERLVAHLTTLFQQLSRDEEVTDWHNLMLPKHSQRHHALKVFSDLVGWLANTRLAAYKTLQDRYVAYTSELYTRHLLAFFDSVKAEIRPPGFDRKPSVSSKMSTATLGRGSQSPAVGRPARPDDGQGAHNREHFQKLMETLLSELEPVVLDEQKFVIRFLHLQSTATTGLHTTHSLAQLPASDKAFNEQVRVVLEALFKPVFASLKDFVADCRRANPANAVFLLARLSRHVLSVQDTGSYIAVIFGSVLIIVKREFDEYMGGLETALRDAGKPRKGCVGILDSLALFEETAGDMEFAWRGVERRAEMDKWGPKLVGALWDGIEAAAASDASKSPAPVVRMENYHRLHSLLAALKVPALEPMRKESRQRYQDAVAAYSAEYMGKPLEKLNNFFDQIQVSLDRGMRAEEIGYQAAFSKTELKRHIAAYPGKDLRKGLDAVYRKLEKHLGDDSPLLQVVWHQMQNDVLEQYKGMEAMMVQCYPNSQLHLDFSLPDLLSFFSDIAAHH